MNTESQEKNIAGAHQTLMEICAEYRETLDARSSVDRILAEIPVGAMDKRIVGALVSYDVGEISHADVMDCACSVVLGSISATPETKRGEMNPSRVVQITDIDNNEKLVAVFRHDSIEGNLVSMIFDKEIHNRIENVLGYKPHTYRAGLAGLYTARIMLAKDHFLVQDTIVASPPGYFDGEPSHQTWTQGEGKDRYFRITVELCYGAAQPRLRYL